MYYVFYCLRVLLVAYRVCIPWYVTRVYFFFFKQKTAYELRISDWSSDVCSSDLSGALGAVRVACSAAPTPSSAFINPALLAASRSEKSSTTLKRSSSQPASAKRSSRSYAAWTDRTGGA